MNNNRFSTSLHILTLLCLENDRPLSSDYIAGSININPVLVRKEIGALTKLGLIKSKQGKNGGYSLGKAPSDITLSDIFRGVSPSNILGRFNNTNPKCPVGNQFNHHINKISQRAEAAFLSDLQAQSLEDFCGKFI
ncbi:HTH domain-containing protein [Pedobacter sp. HMF7647]|uniref:HTH domain-containing protein n=1 Tax=Hufsiella arboris TaxID=2695275 RepID=A0A7K1YDB5_9SPHI|nr:Rrf2 family transcriptional regulator [Hufsiella arboris]MXV52586.1 HTH domain-containing protein [Hufsiella arboris]